MTESALPMPSLFRRLTVSASLVALAACATTAPAAGAARLAEPAPPAPAVEQKSAHERLFDLFKASDEAASSATR